MTRFVSSAINLLLVLVLGVSLSGCVTTRLPVASTSPWQALNLDTEANPLDVAFTDSRHGYLVGSNRMIRETNDGGATWNERSLDLPEEENFRLISIDFNGDEGWIAGQPGLLMHTSDGGQNWTRLFLDTKLPGEPYLITALGSHSAEMATNVGAVYETHDDGGSWEALVTDAAGAVRDLRRGDDGSYVSVSSLGNFYATWQPGDTVLAGAPAGEQPATAEHRLPTRRQSLDGGPWGSDPPERRNGEPRKLDQGDHSDHQRLRLHGYGMG